MIESLDARDGEPQPDGVMDDAVEALTMPVRQPQRFVLASPPVEGTREELEAWAKALIDSMRPEEC